MKKKLFTLLTLLCLCVTGAWADETPTWSVGTGSSPESSSFLGDVSAYGLTISAAETWNNNGYVEIKVTADEPGKGYLKIKSASRAIKKVAFLLGSGNTTDDHQPVAFGWATDNTSATADTYDIPSAYKYTATNFEGAVWKEYDMSKGDVDIKCVCLYRATKKINSTKPAYTGSSTALGKAKTSRVYGIKVWLEDEAATKAPSTPTLTVDGGNVNGGSKTTIASADAQKIFYCWTNSPTAPAQNAENTWTEAKGASYEYTIPNVSATGMYLHAYGWNNYNTSSASATKTSAAFNVTKVKQAAGLAYETIAVEKNVSANKFINALTNPNNLTVTYTVVDGATATGVSVDASTGEVTVGSVAGTATIKAYFAGNDDYNAGEATYTLTVVTPDPVIEAANVNISKTATGGNIAYNVGYHSAHNGNVTATTDAGWITLGTVTLNANGSGTVAFTNSANTTPVTRYANVTLTYTYNTNSTKTTTMIVAQDPNLVGFSIIKVAVTDYNAGTATGTIGGNATVSLENSSLGGGYKFGKKAYITLTLANSKTFEEGDVIVVHTTKAADTTPGTLAMYSGDDLVLNTGTRGILGINAFALPAAAEGKTSIAVKRTDTYNWNGYVDYIEVIRTTTTVTTNAGGWASFTPGSNCTLSEGAQAYIVTDVNSTSVEVTPVTTLEKGKGYFIQGQEASHAYTATATTADADATTGNLIVGCTTATEIGAASPSTDDKYVLGTATAGANVGRTGLFLVDSNVTVGAGKAYLQTSNTQGARFLSLIDDNETTGITNLNVNDNAIINANAPMYNLAGQKVGKNYNGIVIVNGKKVLRK